MTSPLEKLRHLRSLADKATPRPWYFDKEGCCYGDLDILHEGSTNPPVIEPVTGHLVDIEQADADYIAAAANLLPALVRVAESALRQFDAVRGCVLCTVWWEAGQSGGWKHHYDCPLAALERALGADHG
jgi:hypothetical protein